ncbi:hypothetical protein EJ063_07555 [Vibrio aquaticus]|uniref:Uncharacterized protein n=1 Tax=Vibrio aquaticus TaxID=2496559 RepID=A0A432CXS1_9VIBR|nr:hypothetical protein [Vibrio aquaticus]RTZ16642.1 hypothetical protein EJ063_07555 [Vibrio aquaticus]
MVQLNTVMPVRVTPLDTNSTGEVTKDFNQNVNSVKNGEQINVDSQQHFDGHRNILNSINNANVIGIASTTERDISAADYNSPMFQSILDELIDGEHVNVNDLDANKVHDKAVKIYTDLGLHEIENVEDEDFDF